LDCIKYQEFELNEEKKLMEPQSEFEVLFHDSMSNVDMTPGSIVTATVIEIRNDYVVINAGLKSEGIIPKNQFLNLKGELEISLGDEVEVTLDMIEDGYGETIMSREKAKRTKVWDELEKVQNSQENIEGRVSGKVKGGFTVDLMNIKAFLPGSLVDIRPTKETDYIEGKVLEFKIIKMDKVRNNIVLSRKAVLMDQNSSPEEIAEKYTEGKVVKGFIKNLTDYGAFIDLGGIDGLLHITDISWKRINHPSEILRVGDEMDVVVLKYDQEKNRVSLGMKQLDDDPWDKIPEKLELNAVYKGKVANIADYGVFVDLGDNVEGLVRTSELNWTNKNINPNKVVNLGDEIDVKVMEIDNEKRRVSLSHKQCLENPWTEFGNNNSKGDIVTSQIKSITDFGIFVGLDGGIDGLIHITDITSEEKQEEAIRSYKKGDDVTSIILSIDSDRERVSLGIKQLSEDKLEVSDNEEAGSE
jgi:small subunit ribosomal protein S1|tara:strand:- start:4374 stop:5786 length:1413 start_codon:yes stop_codon:yes gene_type:complete